MSKAKKILLIIFISLIISIGVGITVCFIVFPTQSQEYYEKFKELLCQPLPIVGVSLVVLMTGILAIINRTSIGSKFLKKLKEQNDTLKNDYEKQIKEANEILEKTKQTLEFTQNIVVEVCNTSPNKKVQSIAKKVINYETKEEVNG